jgi:hypothetical protein
MNKHQVRLSLYDGQRLLGHLIDNGKNWRATDANGRALGNFSSRNVALAAISAAVPAETGVDPENEQAATSGDGGGPSNTIPPKKARQRHDRV